MTGSPATREFYAEIRTLLGNASPAAASPPGGPSPGPGPGGGGGGGGGANGGGLAAEPPPHDRPRQVEADQARALKSLSELAKRNEEAERRAKATVHALSSKYLKMLEKNPDVYEGDPLFFFGYGLECMEDILHAGYCQVNASVTLYLEELDARFHNLLVMAETIDAARLKAEALDDARQRALEALETRQAAWLDEAQKLAASQREGWGKARAAADAKTWEAVRAAQRPLRRAVGLLAVLTAALAGFVLFYILKIHL